MCYNNLLMFNSNESDVLTTTEYFGLGLIILYLVSLLINIIQTGAALFLEPDFMNWFLGRCAESFRFSMTYAAPLFAWFLKS